MPSWAALTLRLGEPSTPVVATIVEIERNNVGGRVSYRPYIEYEIDGVTIIAPMVFWNENMFVGQPVAILVSEHDPYRFGIQDNLLRLPVFILGGIMLVFWVAGIVFLLCELYVRLNLRKLRKSKA